MPDIKELLFPNVITVLVQLCSTGVIYFLYKKYLHEPVLKVLDNKSESFIEAYTKVEDLKKQQVIDKERFEKEKAQQHEALERSKQMMLQEIEDLREKLLKDTQDDINRMRKDAASAIERDKEEMLKEVEKELVDIAYVMTEKVLEGYRFNESEMLSLLEKEMVRSHVRS